MTDLQQSLSEDFDYNPETGILTWKRGQFKGRSAGCKRKDGYIQVAFAYRLVYGAHEIIWAIMTGAYPIKPLQIDHINRIKDDNRWINLRLVTPSINALNNNAEGVCFARDKHKWRAYISINGKRKYLGSFNSYEEAKQKRDKEHEQVFAAIGHK